MQLKEELWQQSQRYPLYSCLKAKNAYIFTCINQMAEKEELVDEAKLLNEVRPFQPVLQVVEKKDDRKDRIRKSQISALIGKPLHEFESLKTSEVSDFRIKMKQVCKEIGRKRDSKHWLERAKYLYPPEVATDEYLPAQFLTHLSDNNFIITVHFENTSIGGMGHSTFRVPLNAFASELIDLVLHKRSNITGLPVENKEDYLLKVSGREEYLLDNLPLAQYQYMRQMLAKGVNQQLHLMHKDAIFKDTPPVIPPRGSAFYVNTQAMQATLFTPRPRPENAVCAWEVRDAYSLTVNRVTNVGCEDFAKVQLRVGLYYGGETLCSHVVSEEAVLTSSCATVDANLQFGIDVMDIPRMARLCFALVKLSDKRTGKRQHTGGKKQKRLEAMTLAWVNLPVYDYVGKLRSGQNTLFMWSVTDDDMLTEEFLNPIGTVECNPNSSDAVQLTFTFCDYNLEEPIYFPPFLRVLEVAAENSQFHDIHNGMDLDELTEALKYKFDQLMLDVNTVNKYHLEQLRIMIDRDSLTTMLEQEKEMMWNLRYECRYHFPHSLPKLLRCVQWNKHTDVAQMQALLLFWPPLSPTEALELLDFRYDDGHVRTFAVKCIRKFSDTELCQYLLQLVQVIKYESYLDCDLVGFLLERALNSQRVGHYFFWLLRSEMYVPSVSVRFGLILEAYFHGTEDHMKPLQKQIDALTKLKSINQIMQGDDYKDLNKTKTKAVMTMKQLLQQNTYVDCFSSLQCSLDPTIWLKELRIESCKFFDSKMRPLKLVWENKDSYGIDQFIMYKNGDDLRQDMLTIQILRIMDNIWQSEELDLRLNAYGCLSTGCKEGLIEMVVPSNTIANIQKEYAALKVKSAFNRQCLYKWLEKKNPDANNLMKAIEEFTLSAAGYCVATYVLGIADRHSDNIMLKENGQLFHIDFGHILGNFKYKFGLKRERVPFVLTSDMVYVIRRGPADDNAAFRRFRQLVDDAYLALRRKTNFLITLFLMMTNTGIPELCKPEAIEYLKETLVPHLSEEEGRKHFQEKFHEALKDSWKTSVNFMVHNIARGGV